MIASSLLEKWPVSKIAILTDTHFGARSDSLIFNEFFYDFYENSYMQFLRDNLEVKDIPKQTKRKRSKKGIEHFIEEELNENEI